VYGTPLPLTNMQFLIDKIRKLDVGWNERPLTEEDFYTLCGRFGVTIEEEALSKEGFYSCFGGRHFIALDRALIGRERMRRFVMFHEFAHFLMHEPSTATTVAFHGLGPRTRAETEADIFALAAVLPLSLISCRTPQELIDEGFPPDMVRARFELYESRGI
jgi:Zn-dependent peptidase ImmA (M78 family)